MSLDISTISKITTECTTLFPEMRQDDLDAVIKYMSRNASSWHLDDIPTGVRKCLPLALRQRDHTVYFVLGVFFMVFFQLILGFISYMIMITSNLPFVNKNIDPVIM